MFVQITPKYLLLRFLFTMVRRLWLAAVHSSLPQPCANWWTHHHLGWLRHCVSRITYHCYCSNFTFTEPLQISVVSYLDNEFFHGAEPRLRVKSCCNSLSSLQFQLISGYLLLLFLVVQFVFSFEHVHVRKKINKISPPRNWDALYLFAYWFNWHNKQIC